MSRAYRFVMSGSQEVPGNGSAASGLGFAVFHDTGALRLDYRIAVNGLDLGPWAGLAPQTPDLLDNVVDAHFHQAISGANGPVRFGWRTHDADDFAINLDLDGTWRISGSWETTDSVSVADFSASFASAALGQAIDFYGNIHTTGFPGGEIRGQLVCIATDDGESVIGGATADFLPGLGGNDYVNGMGGDDVLSGGAGTDWLIGGDGQDTGDWSEVTTSITVEGSSGFVHADGAYDWTDSIEIWRLGSAGDVFTSRGASDLVFGGAGDDWMGDSNAGADTFHGEAGDDALHGGGGGDWLEGGDGADLITGGADVDVLYGGAGQDWMRGDAGADTFRFGDWSDIEWDALVGFDSGEDRIDLAGFGVTLVGAFSGVAGQMTVTAGVGEAFLRFDVDGDGAADRFLYVTGDTPMAGDFLLDTPGGGPLPTSPLVDDLESKETFDAPIICDAWPSEEAPAPGKPVSDAPVICEPTEVELDPLALAEQMLALHAVGPGGMGRPMHRLSSYGEDGWII